MHETHQPFNSIKNPSTPLLDGRSNGRTNRSLLRESGGGGGWSKHTFYSGGGPKVPGFHLAYGHVMQSRCFPCLTSF